MGDAINISTSSKLLNPSRTYTIFDAQGQLYKFGVTDAAFNRMYQALSQAGTGATFKYSSIITKQEAHLLEKIFTKLTL